MSQSWIHSYIYWRVFAAAAAKQQEEYQKTAARSTIAVNLALQRKIAKLMDKSGDARQKIGCRASAVALIYSLLRVPCRSRLTPTSSVIHDPYFIHTLSPSIRDSYFTYTFARSNPDSYFVSLSYP